MGERKVAVSKRIKWISLFFSFLLLFSLVIFCNPVYGEENEITITPLTVDGQRVTTAELVLPLDGKKHQLQLSVTNFTNQQATVVLQGAQATMDATGEIDYQPKKKFAGKLPLNFGDLIPPQNLTLAAGETQDITLSLDFQQVTQGEVAGAVLITKDEEAAYMLPVTLVGKAAISENLAVTKLTGQLANDLPALGVTIVNPQAKYLLDQDVQLSITHEKFFGLVKKTWQVDLSQLDFVPNGKFVYPISLAGQALENGRYTITGVLGSGDNQVKVNQNFTITKKQARAINKQVPTLKDATLRRLIIIAIGLTVVLVLVITVAIYQNKRHKHSKKPTANTEDAERMQGGKKDEKYN